MKQNLKNALCALACRMASKIEFKVVDTSPESYAEILASHNEVLPILGKFSETSIYGQWGNICQRAWHDSLHISLRADTEIRGGELLVAREQARQASLWSAKLADVVYADLYGQGEHYLKYGVFPLDQEAFVDTWLNNPKIVRKF